jgi:hypothetical protein
MSRVRFLFLAAAAFAATAAEAPAAVTIEIVLTTVAPGGTVHAVIGGTGRFVVESDISRTSTPVTLTGKTTVPLGTVTSPGLYVVRVAGPGGTATAAVAVLPNGTGFALTQRTASPPPAPAGFDAARPSLPAASRPTASSGRLRRPWCRS